MNHGAPTVNILMAEDDDAEFELVRRAFASSRLSCRLTRFANGKDLLDFLLARGGHAGRVIDKNLPCIVLLDMDMPVLDGRDTLKALKSHPLLRRLPVIMLTGSAADEDVVNAYDLGANSFVRKPLTYGDFVEAVNALELFWFDVAVLPVPLDLPGRGAQAQAPASAGRKHSRS